MLTPGAYLKLRREAASMSIADVAQQLSTVPRMAEHALAEWVTLIEADAVPAGFSTIVALHSTFPFDLAVLARLESIRLGLDLQPPRLCRTCGCSHRDPWQVGRCDTCCWIAADLCSACESAVVAPAVAA